MQYPFIKTLSLLMLCLLLANGCREGARAFEESDPTLIEELKLQAASQVSILNFDRAYGYYQKIQESSRSGSADWALATFGMATCAWHRLPASRSNIAEATRLFTALVDDPSIADELRAQALISLGRILEMENFPGDRVDPASALQFYERILREFPRSVFADEAAGRIAANSLIGNLSHDRIRAAFTQLETYLQSGVDEAIAGALWNFLGEQYWNILQDAERSVAAMRETVKTTTLQANRLGTTYWRIAWLAETELNDPELAATYYQRIIDELPRSTRGHGAKLAIERLSITHPHLLDK